MIPNNPIAYLTKDSARSMFESSDALAQIALLESLIKYVGGKVKTCDLRVVKGPANVGDVRRGSKLSTWVGKNQEVRIIDRSCAGLFESQSENILEWL